ncbi:unnamed protein product [Boreogadus saida]
MALHYVLEHLDTAGNYARILFVDLSLAFNTIIPHTLERLISLLQGEGCGRNRWRRQSGVQQDNNRSMMDRDLT